MSEGPADGFRLVGESVVHEGHVWRVVVADFESPHGERFRRDIVRSPGAVGVVPVLFDAEGNPSVALVSQYRPAHGAAVVEIPAGMRDVAGEDTTAVAARELREEAGLAAGHLELLTELLPSPGMTDAMTTIYLATGCTPVAVDRHGPEEEHMTLVHLPLDEALASIERGELTDAKTVVGLLLAERRLRLGDGG